MFLNVLKMNSQIDPPPLYCIFNKTCYFQHGYAGLCLKYLSFEEIHKKLRTLKGVGTPTLGTTAQIGALTLDRSEILYLSKIL